MLGADVRGAPTRPGWAGWPSCSTTRPGCRSTSTRPSGSPTSVGRRQKDEAYHFLPGVDPGAHPETFLGVQPYLARGPREEALLPYLQAWDSDLILTTSRPTCRSPAKASTSRRGCCTVPGTALTLELQEDSDVLSMFQALNAGRIISKELLYKDVRAVDRDSDGELFPLGFVDWARNGDPDLHRHARLSPQPVAESMSEGGRREWIFYGSPKFSGQRVTVEPGRTVRLVDPGVHSVFVWSGTGHWGRIPVSGGVPGADELLVTQGRAATGVDVRADGGRPLVAYLLFGPDLQPAVPVPAASEIW